MKNEKTPGLLSRFRKLSGLAPRNAFDVGPWNFTFERTVRDEVRQRIREIFQEAYSRVEALVGTPSESRSGEWKIEVSNVEGDFNKELTDQRILSFVQDSTDATKIHELTHLFQGRDFPEVNWIREGTAVAASNIVAEAMGIPRWDALMPRLPQMGGNARKHLGIHPRGRYEYFRPLLEVRYRHAGRFWEDFEKSRLGGMKTLFENMHASYSEDTKEEIDASIAGTPVPRLLEGIFGKLPQAYKRYRTLLEPSKSPEPHTDMVYAYCDQQPGRSLIHIHAVRRTPDTAEIALLSRPGLIEIENPRNKRFRFMMPITTEEGGTKLDTAGLKNAIGNSKSYEGKISVEGCKPERLTFSLQED